MQHFPRCVRSPRISVGTRSATPRPCMGAAMDTPMLHELTIVVGVGRAGIAMPSGYLPAMYLLLRLGRSHSLFEGLNAVVGMHGVVAIAVEDNGWDRLPAWNSVPTATTLT